MQTRCPIVMFIRALHGGGAQQDAAELTLGLARAGWPMVVATLDASGPLRARLAGVVPLLDLGQGRKRRMASAFLPLRDMLIRHRPSAIIASEAAANCLVVLAAGSVSQAHRPAVLLREVAAPLRARRHDPYLQNRLAIAWRPGSMGVRTASSVLPKAYAAN